MRISLQHNIWHRQRIIIGKTTRYCGRNVPGVLVAISIPIFTSQLTKARRATNQANARAAYAEASADLLTNDKTSAEATTAPAQSTGKFDSITSAPSWFTNYSDFSVTKGKAFKVTVTDAGAVTVEQE
jgi:hypothetical protein